MMYLNLLQSMQKTCMIFQNDQIVYDSEKRGVQPLIEFLSKNIDGAGNYILADRIIGKGAVVLAKLIGIVEIHTPIISQDALLLANEYGIDCHYEKLVKYIKNREYTGRCPIESSVLDITDPNEGYQKIIETLQKLIKAT